MIDLHCHVDLYENPQAVLERADASGIYVLSVTTTPKAWCGTNNLGKKYKRVRTSLGLHPQLVEDRYQELSLFERLLPEVQYVGEIGLDKGRHYKATFDRQEIVFTRILEMCSKSGGKILSIHSTYAVNEVLDHLERFPQAGPPIMHWFTGSLSQLQRAVALGCWFSVGPKMILSKKGRDIVLNIPLDKLLLETDGPFTKSKEGKPFEPIDTLDLIDDLSALLRINKAELRSKIINNFKDLTSFNT